MLVRAFAHRYPDEVVGIVLVDSAHENQLARLPSMHNAFDQLVQQFSLLGNLASLGLIALAPEQIPNQGLPDKALAEYRALLATTNYFDAAAKESEAFRATLEETAGLPLPTLGDLPLIVISRGQEDPSPGLTAAEVAQNAEAWQRMQAELATLSAQSQHIYAEQSGHYIQLQQPTLVIDAIRQMIQMAHDGQRYSK
jgi:pimeloyl-ACP methyl ester carboxylesterase